LAFPTSVVPTITVFGNCDVYSCVSLHSSNMIIILLHTTSASSSSSSSSSFITNHRCPSLFLSSSRHFSFSCLFLLVQAQAVDGNVLDLYPRGARFESRPENRVTWQKFSVVISVCPDTCRKSTLKMLWLFPSKPSSIYRLPVISVSTLYSWRHRQYCNVFGHHYFLLCPSCWCSCLVPPRLVQTYSFTVF